MNLTVIYIEDVRLPVLLENIGAFINSHFFESGTMPTPTSTNSQNSTGLGQEVYPKNERNI